MSKIDFPESRSLLKIIVSRKDFIVWYFGSELYCGMESSLINRIVLELVNFFALYFSSNNVHLPAII